MDVPAEALLRHIIDQDGGVSVDGAPMHLLVPVPPAMADALAAWGADREDMEDGGDTEDSDDVA